MPPSSPEKNLGSLQSPEAAPAIVSQPVKIENQLGSFLDQISQMSENAKDGPGEQWSGQSGGTATTGGTQTGTPVVSARDQAIAAIPATAVMQKQLEKHIRVEIKHLRRQAQMISRMNKPGAAYHLNQLYTRMRHLNALLAEILEASYDALKRLFIKVFIDKQAIL